VISDVSLGYNPNFLKASYLGKSIARVNTTENPRVKKNLVGSQWGNDSTIYDLHPQKAIIVLLIFVLPPIASTPYLKVFSI
jgi:hypothetical protein